MTEGESTRFPGVQLVRRGTDIPQLALYLSKSDSDSLFATETESSSDVEEIYQATG